MFCRFIPLQQPWRRSQLFSCLPFSAIVVVLYYCRTSVFPISTSASDDMRTSFYIDILSLTKDSSLSEEWQITIVDLYRFQNGTLGSLWPPMHSINQSSHYSNIQIQYSFAHATQTGSIADKFFWPPFLQHCWLNMDFMITESYTKF